MRKITFLKQHKAATYSIISLLLRVFSGPLSIVLVTTNFSLDEQAIYYTFISISAIQWVFELGISTSLVQSLSGSKSIKEKISLLRLSNLFYLGITPPLFLTMLIYAHWTFTGSDINAWLLPWLLYSTSICLNIITNVIYIHEEGELEVNLVYKAKLLNGLVYSIGLIVSLFIGLGLYSLFVSQMMMLISTIFIFRKSLMFAYFDIWKCSSEPIISTMKKIIPFQAKLSLVWILGYIYWNFYPIYFYKYVSIDFSALYGASNAVVSAIAIAMTSWVQTKRSILSNLALKKEYNQSVKIFKGSFIIGVIGYIFASVFFILIINIAPHHYVTRFLSLELMITLILMRFAILLQELILIYLRTYQDEPLYKETLLNYACTPFVAIATTYYLSYEYIFVVSFLIQLVFLILYIINGSRFVKQFTCSNRGGSYV